MRQLTIKWAGKSRPLAFADEYDSPIEAIRNEIKEVKALTDKSFAVQLLAPDNIPSDASMIDDIVNVYKDEGVEYVFMISTTDNPKESELKIVRRLKDEGFTMIWRDVNPSVQGALDAQEAGADIIIATGRDEGGSLPAGTTGTLTIIWYPPAKITTSDIVITSQWHKTYHLVTLKLPLGKIDD